MLSRRWRERRQRGTVFLHWYFSARTESTARENVSP